MTITRKVSDQEAFDALLRTRLAAFTRKAFSTVDPSTPYSHNWHIDLIAEYLEACTRREIKRLIINIPPRAMKLLADDTPVPTPQGIKSHGELQVGDWVYAPSGKSIQVIAKTEKVPADYEVTFTNDEAVKCNLDHLWTVYDRASRRWRTMDTRAILKTKYYSGDRCRFQLPDSGTLEHDAKDLPLSPYFMGAWLGDGTHSKPCITHDISESEVVSKIIADGYAVSTICPHTSSRACTTYFSKNGIGKKLQALGVWRNKHIPEQYLCSSIEQRLELLAGIVDTDGTVCRDTGRVTVCGTNLPLMKGVFRLCAELGFRPYETWGKTPGIGNYPGGQDVCRVGFNPTLPIPTQLKRKSVYRYDHVRRYIGIRKVQKLDDPAIGNCITVDSPDGLYIVGKKHVVTHNSISVTVAWPAWLLGLDPAERIIAASYAHTLSLKHSIDTRLIVRSDWYQRVFPATRLVDDQDTKQKFVTTRRGMRYATSVDGSAIGEGGNFLIVDDPTSATEALSDVQRTKANTWFDQGFATRLNDKNDGVIVVVMQRLHAQDLTGHLLEKGGWEHLCLPAIAERNETITFGRVSVTREAGEALHPAREGIAVLEAQKVALGSYAFAGQYQQRPAPAEGGTFKADWFRRYERPLDSYTQIVQSWDTAYKASQHNDPSACTTWGVRPDGYDLLHVLAKRYEYPELKSKAIVHAAEFGATAVLIEDKASGQSLIQDLRRETALPVIAITPQGDKTTRAVAVSALIEAGKVALPTQAAWLTDYEMEMLQFPTAVHDDQVDSTTQFLEWMRSKSAAPTFRIW